MLSNKCRQCLLAVSGRGICLPRRPFRHQGRPQQVEQPNLLSDPGGASAGTTPAGWSSLARPLVFTVGFGATTFAAAAVWQYENMRAQAKSLWRGQRDAIMEAPVFGSIFGGKEKAGRWREELNKYWNHMPESDKVFLPILAVNVAVFLAWRAPIKGSMQAFMLRNFASNPTAKKQCWPMLFSSFSHFSVLHLVANMYVLHSFSGPLCSLLGKEQFAGLYLTAGVASAFCSNLCKVATGRIGYSLGASGAILALIGVFGSLAPEAKMQIIFLPALAFTAGAAIKAIVVMDTVGVLLGWRFFDHAAHLGGVLFGVWWVKQGNELVWGNRETVMKFWHERVRGENGRKRSPPGGA